MLPAEHIQPSLYQATFALLYYGIFGWLQGVEPPNLEHYGFERDPDDAKLWRKIPQMEAPIPRAIETR